MTLNSLAGSGRTILSVVGCHSRCGKTSFVTLLLRDVRGLGCLKISPADDWGEATPEGAESVGEHYYIEDSARLRRPGKDTTLYMEAGAAEVKRLTYDRADGLAAGLDAALQRFPPTMPTVVESSSAVLMLRPVAVVLVVRPPLREMKPGTEAILSRVTDLLVNAPDTEGIARATAEQLCHQFPSLRPRFTWFADLRSGPLPQPMLTRFKKLLARP